MESIIISVSTSVVIAIIAWVAGRFSIKTKTQEKADSICARVEKIETALPLLLECQLEILLALKRGKVNGGCDGILDRLNKYLVAK